ncbi:Lrp/AsnC family transcriptional regulator [Pseudooceanicola sp. CBS1P-1]|uniref:AsnC family transcriptional regulator n=1 Tax=Pseudooceanicola albus TaxID=2692189 RepID=A0A6L7G9X2_9RHOB|nr:MULTISPECIES: Lrp/AsnC family transcriptional regulator [Pseudooceanicola]MBT9386279.1 Lrp/AsnC family transcriptional regulator [Pseudooceanicola endophyticus]MXN20328.1 AsnC family transcriptional regulator [Pseudooceanicola albus]
MDLDPTNKRLLALLQEDARLSAAELGRRVGLSRPAVQGRIQAMERAGILRGYHAEISGAGLIEAVILMTIAERPCDRALQWLRGQEGVTSVLSLAGEIDALARVTVPDPAALSALGDRILASGLIASAKTHVVLRRYGG